MACCMFRSSSSSSSSSSTVINNVRVVDLNGYVEEFDYPVSVSQVAGQPPKHFVFTAAQLLSSAIKPLKPETLLQPGHIYFLLPCSAFQTDVSPLGLAIIVKKLTAKAKSNNPSSSPARSPLRAANGGERLPARRSWKPILDTIREMSFKRSESDLKELKEIQIGDHERHQF
ncbi:DUF4228 domain protein [Melia azedarach]|uniref:DUF4228 domain protein n=1 Tax=Melia azedarach TaxID=155640 RepID=A0ACC1XER0_MELAZ|nr:DUF4228 domain protein [Melia azedarach]